jgi:hypothetical protein
VKLPVLEKRTLYLNFGPVGRPEPWLPLPLITLEPVGAATSGLKAAEGRPLNHMSLPPASLAPLTGTAGLMTANAGAGLPFGGKKTLWKPRNV